MKETEIKEIFNIDGNKVGEAEYVDGKANGMCRLWSSNGTLLLEAEMKNDQYHGKFQSWWASGQKKEIGEYKNGKKIGIYKWYTEEGTLWQEHDYSSDE